MAWTAPEIEREDEPVFGDEWTMTIGRLERNRRTFLYKCGGLTGEQLARQSVPPSNLSLLGLVRHLTDVERTWFRRRFRGDDAPRLNQVDQEFDEVDPARAELEYGVLLTETDLARNAVAGASLDDTFTHELYGELSLRWLFGHVIEEYARHNGHADLLRERIDGVTGA
jgi:hypothetical protein